MYDDWVIVLNKKDEFYYFMYTRFIFLKKIYFIGMSTANLNN
jgi:hypothetical protein